jgi:formylmethanofuran dehydrogenase subunit E
VKLWHWIAWNKGRERICDCGIARADSEAVARGIAAQCLGGPYMLEVETFDVRQVWPDLGAQQPGHGRVTVGPGKRCNECGGTLPNPRCPTLSGSEQCIPCEASQ